jgi:TIR domain-containing protein
MRMSLPKDVPENWDRWIYRTIWCLLAAGAFLLPAPVGMAEPNQRPILVVVRLAIAALVGLMSLPLKLCSQRRHLPIWGTVATVFSLLSIISLVSYEQLKQSWTVSYSGKRVVAGSTLTPDAENYHRAHPQYTAAELLEDAAGDPQKVWTRESTEPRRLKLNALYFSCIPTFAIAVLALVHSLYCARRKDHRRRMPDGKLVPFPDAAKTQEPGSAEVPHVSTSFNKADVYDAFISYRRARRDKSFALQLMRDLEQLGYRVALDERDFDASASFLEEMERCVRNSRFTLAVVSPRYLQSGHCQEEAILCKVLDMGERKRRLVPLMIQKVEMPVWMFGIVGVDFTKTNPVIPPLEKLVNTLGKPLSSAEAVRRT